MLTSPDSKADIFAEFTQLPRRDRKAIQRSLSGDQRLSLKRAMKISTLPQKPVEEKPLKPETPAPSAVLSAAMGKKVEKLMDERASNKLTEAGREAINCALNKLGAALVAPVPTQLARRRRYSRHRKF